jgi:hypothetical protein
LKRFKVVGALGLGVLAVVLLRASDEKESVPTPVHGPHIPSDDQKLLPADSGLHVQDAMAQLTAEPMPHPSDNPHAESFADQDASGGSRGQVDTRLVDRTPLPFRRSSCIGFEFPDMPCVTERALDSEQIDPAWSSATEDQLRSIWREAAAGMSDEFLYVECKTTVCEVTYRFPRAPGDQAAYQNRYFNRFLAALRASDLGAELCPLSFGYGGYAQNTYLRRTARQSAPDTDSRTSPYSSWCKH